MAEHAWTAAVHEAGDAVTLDVEVVPNASSPGFPVGFNPWRKRLQARVSAPAHDGLANEELVSLVARTLHVPTNQVSVVDGATSRRKRIRIATRDALAIREIIGEALHER